MNIFDINFEKGFIMIAISNKVALIPFNKFKTNNIELTGKIKYIIEAQVLINHLKLMKGLDDDDLYILAVDDSGILHSKQLFKSNNDFLEKGYKKFSCCIQAHDNSTWSLDCNYPFVTVGGNHHCVVVINVEDVSEEDIISNSIVLSGNKHNVPAVCFCENFVSCNSIDGTPKIWDLYNTKIVKKIANKTKEW
jgi:hypothetical protein